MNIIITAYDCNPQWIQKLDWDGIGLKLRKQKIDSKRYLL